MRIFSLLVSVPQFHDSVDSVDASFVDQMPSLKISFVLASHVDGTNAQFHFALSQHVRFGNITAKVMRISKATIQIICACLRCGANLLVNKL